MTRKRNLQAPNIADLKFLYDGTTHFLDTEGHSVPEYKILADGSMSLTVNAIDWRKLPSYSEEGYISVEAAKANTVEYAKNALNSLIKQYIDGEEGNERNVLMALYRGAGVDVSNTALSDLKVDFLSSNNAYHQRAARQLDQLERDLRPVEQHNNEENNYDIATLTASFCSMYQK